MHTLKTLIVELRSMGITENSVLEAMSTIPRHLFVLSKYSDEAYNNYPLPIGYGQTISQPYTVAFMLQSLDVKPNHKVLEIGAGSGYNAAILGKLVGEKGKIYSTEIVQDLKELAEENIIKTGLNNVIIIQADGSVGYEKQAPYGRIIVTAGCPDIPQPLLNQLKIGGILVAPVESFLGYEMIRIIKKKAAIEKQKLGRFSFVPLKGKCGYC